MHGGELTAVLGSKGSGKRALLEVFQSIFCSFLYFICSPRGFGSKVNFFLFLNFTCPLPGDLQKSPGSHQGSDPAQRGAHVHAAVPGELRLRHPEVRPARRPLRGGHPHVRRLDIPGQEGVQLCEDCQGETGLLFAYLVLVTLEMSRCSRTLP